MQHSIQDQSRASSGTTYAVPTSTARSLSPPADALQITDSVSNAILTPKLNSASPGAERLASVSSINESASQRLSAVNSALQNAEDRDAGRAQLSPQPAPARDESPGRAALALRKLSQGLRVVFPGFTDLMIQAPPPQKLTLPEPTPPVPYSPPSSLDNALPPPDLSLQLAVRNRINVFNGPDNSQAIAPRSQLRIGDRRPIPQTHFNDTTRHQPEYFQLHDSNSPDPGPRTALGLLDDDSNPLGISTILEGNELQLFNGNYEACVEARYEAQIMHLTASLQQAVIERDTKIVSIAHRNLVAEQAAMNHRLQLHTYQMRLRVAHAEAASREATNVATDVIAGEYSSELRSALDAQKFMFKENDAMQMEELEVYREAWREYEQLQVLCHQEVGIIAVERSELAAHMARLDSSTADLIRQREFDFQIVADAVERHLRA